jgi:hypothetical protein
MNTIETASSSEVSNGINVEKSELTPSLKKIIMQWYKLAKLRYETVAIADWHNKELVTRAADSLRVFDEIRLQVKKDLSNASFYFAYDERDKLQGVALVRSTETYEELECIATNPKNFALFEGETAKKGVGYSLLCQVVSDVYTASNKSLVLQALPSAVSFYKKFSFINNPNQAAKNLLLTPLLLERDAMNALLV